MYDPQATWPHDLFPKFARRILRGEVRETDPALDPRRGCRLWSASPLGKLSGAFIEGQPCRANAQRFGQRFDRIHPSLTAVLDISNGAGRRLDAASQCRFGVPLLDAYRLQARAHVIASRHKASGGHFPQPIGKPTRGHTKRQRQTSP